MYLLLAHDVAAESLALIESAGETSLRLRRVVVPARGIMTRDPVAAIHRAFAGQRLVYDAAGSSGVGAGLSEAFPAVAFNALAAALATFRRASSAFSPSTTSRLITSFVRTARICSMSIRTSGDSRRSSRFLILLQNALDNRFDISIIFEL
jgi:hypothetical protein